MSAQKKILTKFKVMIVDDMQSMRGLLRNAAKSMGFSNIYEAKNGAEALKMFRTVKMDIIVCDWGMPHMDGLELLSKLRPNRLDRSFSFILITAENCPKKLKEAIALGVDDYIVKPFQINQFHQRLISMITNRVKYPTPPAELKVTIIEDMPQILELLKGILGQLGFKQISEFSDSKAALEHLKANECDLVLSDWSMPEMDGLELHSKLQEEIRTRHTPFILITAESDPEKIRAAIAEGIDGYLVKPFHIDAIRRELCRVLTLSKAVNA